MLWALSYIGLALFIGALTIMDIINVCLWPDLEDSRGDYSGNAGAGTTAGMVYEMGEESTGTY